VRAWHVCSPYVGSQAYERFKFYDNVELSEMGVAKVVSVVMRSVRSLIYGLVSFPVMVQYFPSFAFSFACRFKNGWMDGIHACIVAYEMSYHFAIDDVFCGDSFSLLV
jgi:hypothetical protein